MGLARNPLLLAGALALLACGPGSMPRSVRHPLAGGAAPAFREATTETFVVDRRGAVRWVGQSPGDARRAVDVVLSE